MSTIYLYPLNDLALKVGPLYDVVSPSVTPTLLAAGSITGFLSNSNAPSATVGANGNASIAVSVVYSGSGGYWLVAIDREDVTLARLTALLTQGEGQAVYIILELPSGFRVAIEMEYKLVREAVIT